MHNSPLSFLIYLLYFKNSNLLNRCELDPCVYGVFDSESGLELNSELVTLIPGTPPPLSLSICIYKYKWHIIEQRSWEFNLSNQPYMHWNVNTTGTQSPICFGTSSVPSWTIGAILKKRSGWWVCSDPVVIHTAVTTSVVPRSIGGWEWTETDRSDSTT